MQASETKLQPIIEGTKQYLVPLFQREYTWDRKHWDILWSDLIDLYEVDNPRNHFIGSIVTMPTVSVPEGVAKFMLIDGQQRLTTIMIILTLLRDKSKEDGMHELADEINNTLLVNPYKKGIDYFKLLPTQTDRKAFYGLVKNEIDDNNDNQTNIAYQYFKRKIKQANIDIERLKQRITSNLSVVSIVLDVDDNPYLVFESLNAKGKPLTQSDLIRNFFFMRIHVEEQDEIYVKNWKPMQDELGENLTEFIRHYLMKDGLSVKQGEVYFTLKERVKLGDALEYLRELNRYAKYYRKLLNPDVEKSLAIRKELHVIKRLDISTVYPFLLNCYEDYSQNKLSDEEFSELLRVIENFVIRRFICRVPTNQLNKVFPTLYTQAIISPFNSFIENVKLILSRKNYPRDNQFKSSLVSEKLYGNSERTVKTRIILERIEESFQHKEQVNLSTLTIEHIMPQTLTEHWQSYLGEEWEEIHELFLHTIGNLTLTGYNSELSNDTFEEKKKKLIDSHIEMNKYFVDIISWKKEDIDKRSEYLADKIVLSWPYFGNVSTNAITTNDVTGTTPKTLFITGQAFKVETWRDVLTITMNSIIELEPEKFEELLIKYNKFIGKDKNKFRAIRQLKNDIYIEVNMSAQSIQKLCYQVIQEVGLGEDDWRVITA